MARHRGTVLVDTNVILEVHRAGAWRALAGAYPVAWQRKELGEIVLAESG